MHLCCSMPEPPFLWLLVVISPGAGRFGRVLHWHVHSYSCLGLRCRIQMWEAHSTLLHLPFNSLLCRGGDGPGLDGAGRQHALR